MKNKISLALILFSLFLSACNGQSRRVTDNSHSGRYQGNLTELVKKLQASKNYEFCERLYKEKQLEIAEVLDGKTNEFLAQDSEGTAPQGTNLVIQKDPDATFVSDQWIENSYSWFGIIADYEFIKNDPQSKGWAELNESVRHVLIDDEDRILFETAKHVGYRDREYLPKAAQFLKKCQLQDCSNTIDPSVAWFFSQKRIYRKLWAKYQDKKDPQAGLALETLIEWIDHDRKRFLVRVNEGIKVEGNVIQVPLDGSNVNHVKTEIESIIENFWKTKDLMVDLVWSDSADSFKFLIEKVFGFRAYVDFQKRTIHFGLQTSEKVIVHEFGHVLGFRDEYYTLWDNYNCAYKTQSQEDNIMSAGIKGKIKPHHIEGLKKAYGIK